MIKMIRSLKEYIYILSYTTAVIINPDMHEH